MTLLQETLAWPRRASQQAQHDSRRQYGYELQFWLNDIPTVAQLSPGAMQEGKHGRIIDEKVMIGGPSANSHQQDGMIPH
jgi:predicted methyltransferase